VNSYFVVQYDSAGFMDSRPYFCIHKDHKGRPMGRVVHANGVTNLRRHLKDHYDILVVSLREVATARTPS